jgi:hypothetical protein
MDDFDNPILYYRADPRPSPGPEEVDRALQAVGELARRGAR